MIDGASSELARTQAFILAGGQGERLHPLTVSRPKPAVSFGGVFRIIDFTLSNCVDSGVHRVSLLTQYRHEELHRYVRESWGRRWNTAEGALRFLPPTSGKRYRGTADAVFHNLELIEAEKAEFILVLSGDHIYEMNYGALLRQHAETGADLTIATVEHPIEDASRFGVVEVDRTFRVTGFEEKPANPRPLPDRPGLALVNMGVYVFKKNVLLNSLRLHCDGGTQYDFGRDIIPALIHSGRTYAYDFRDHTADTPIYWRDIGTIDSYYEANMDIVPNAKNSSRSTAHTATSFKKAYRGAKILPRVNSDCRVRRTVLSPGVSLGRGAILDESVLMPGVRVGEGARLRRTIVEEGVHIPEGFQAGFDLEHDRRHHTVTQAGVVVVSRIAPKTKSTSLYSLPSGTAAHAAHAM